MANLQISQDCADKIQAVLAMAASVGEADIWPISIISCRPENLLMEKIELMGLGKKTHAFVNASLIEKFKRNYPTINFYEREKYLRPTDFPGFENCAGGARVLSMRGMMSLGFERIISCDDDLTLVETIVPLDDEKVTALRPPIDFYESRRLNHFKQGLGVGSLMAKEILDSNPDCVMGEPAYQGMFFSNKPLKVKMPGTLFVHSDCFFIDLKRFGKVLAEIEMENPLDIAMLKTLEDQYYMLLEYKLKLNHFKMEIVQKNKSTAVVTKNEGRTDSTLRDLLPQIKADPRFSHLFVGDKIKVASTKGKTLNKDWSYFKTHNSKTFYESIVGGKSAELDLGELISAPPRFDIEKVLSTDKTKVTIRR